MPKSLLKSMTIYLKTNWESKNMLSVWQSVAYLFIFIWLLCCPDWSFYTGFSLKRVSVAMPKPDIISQFLIFQIAYARQWSLRLSRSCGRCGRSCGRRRGRRLLHLPPVGRLSCMRITEGAAIFAWKKRLTAPQLEDYCNFATNKGQAGGVFRLVIVEAPKAPKT